MRDVPPATSPWMFLITAASAFFGVVVAQWWTSRREDRNWKNQLQMYATQWQDQRERDAEQREEQRRRDGEQREDQRQRDRELWERERERDAEQREDQRQRDMASWRREDERRFIEHRRVIYSDFLAKIHRPHGPLLRAEIEAIALAADDRSNDEERRRIESDLYEALERADEQLRELSVSLANIDLEAPDSVIELAIPYLEELKLYRNSFNGDKQPKRPDNLHDLVELIRLEMRRDLLGMASTSGT